MVGGGGGGAGGATEIGTGTDAIEIEKRQPDRGETDRIRDRHRD